MLFAPQQVKERGAGNHGSVISTEFDRRIIETNIEWTQFLLQARSQAGIGCYSACQQNLLHVVLLRREAGLDGQHINNGFLETGGQQGHADTTFLSRLCAHTGILADLLALFVAGSTRLLLICGSTLRQVQDRRFQPTEAEIIGAA